MNVTKKKNLIDSLIKLIKLFPEEKLKPNIAFKNFYYDVFENENKINMTEDQIKMQYIALKSLIENKYKNYYSIDDKILKPKSNPDYYLFLLSEVMGTKKASLFYRFKKAFFRN